MSTELEFVTIEASLRELGWRFDEVLPAGALGTLEDFTGEVDFRTALFSPRRRVGLPSFSIATTSLALEDLDGWDDDLLDDIDTLSAAREQVEVLLDARDWRLPSEDELEMACGGGLFPWGEQLPEGVPYGSGTSFQGHLQPNEHGLLLNGDPYRTELVTGHLKLGDGGEALCGGYPWPLAWMSFSPAFRVPIETVEDVLPEYLESVRIRPVRK
ncbi:MAG: hypothetical protein AAF533_08395 [Acidobacteriota bacterium]